VALLCRLGNFLVCGHFSIGIAVLSLSFYLSVVFKQPFQYVFTWDFIVVFVVVVLECRLQHMDVNRGV
jgi:hypothetical protein